LVNSRIELGLQSFNIICGFLLFQLVLQILYQLLSGVSIVHVTSLPKTWLHKQGAKEVEAKRDGQLELKLQGCAEIQHSRDPQQLGCSLDLCHGIMVKQKTSPV
ncbi:hypothetical protein INR49_005078, partial [Caranx melampygus]